jgi:hypothetical protein
MSTRRKPSLRAALVPMLAHRGDPLQIERRRQLLLGRSATVELEDDLAGRIASALQDGVPRTVPEIGKEVRRRRSVVEDVLARDGRFARVPAPPGKSRRAITWTVDPTGMGRVGTSRDECSVDGGGRGASELAGSVGDRS